MDKVEIILQKKFKLAFSGGGFRATFYALGGFKRLVECKLDQSVSSISSVSGGSIAAAAIMVALHKDGVYFVMSHDFERRVITPLIRLGQADLRTKLTTIRFYKRFIIFEIDSYKMQRRFPLSCLDQYICDGIHMKDLQTLPSTGIVILHV